MDDIIVYLIFVAFALLSRFLTKKKEPGAPSRPKSSQKADDEPQRRPHRQPTFEELLREFTTEPAVEKPKKAAERTYKSYEDEVVEVENYEERYLRDEEAKEVYNRSVKQAKKLKTIDELVDYNTIKTKLHDEFDPYHQEQKETLADEIREQLQSPDEVRKAVIYSEILQRKY